MAADIATQYIVIMYATLLFTVLALIETEQNSKSIILQAIAGMMWLLSAFAHFIAGETTSILTYAVTYFFTGLAFIFIIAAFYNSLGMLRARRKPEI